MKALLIAVLITLGLGIAGATFLVGNYISASNYANSAEKQITYQYENNKNISSNTTLRVLEMLQIPKLYKDDLLEIVEATFQGRYGNDGEMMMKWVQEQNIPYDSSMHTRVQQSIESGRNEFQASQTRLLAMKQSYETEMGYVVRGFFINMAGYPKINLNDYDIIISNDTDVKFKKGVDEVLQLL